MRKFLLLKLACLFPCVVFAQDCSSSYFLQDHAEVQRTTFHPKGTTAAVVTYQISDLKKTAQGTKAKIQAVTTAADGSVQVGDEGTIQCNGSTLMTDMRVLLPPALRAPFKGMEVKTDQAFLKYPSDLSLGQILPNGHVHMDISQRGVEFAKVDYTVTHRRVTGQERITTPAGTWDCYKIKYDATMHVSTDKETPTQVSVTEWFAPGFGVVQNTDYDQSGSLIAYSQLSLLKTWTPIYRDFTQQEPD